MEDKHQELDVIMEDKHHGADYDSEAFDFAGFLDDVWGPDALKVNPFATDVLDDLHSIFKNMDLPDNCKQLEFGCGPCIHPIISASRLCSHIVMTEYTSQCRQFIMKWLKGEDIGFNWDHLYQYVGQKEGRSAEVIEKRTRAAVKEVIYCDIYQEEIFGGAMLPEFDVITSCMCLELACHDLPTYNNTIAKLADHIKPGGYIVICGLLGQNSYMIRDKLFHCLDHRKSDIDYALNGAGFEDIQWYDHPWHQKQVNYISQYNGSGHFCVVARKKKYFNEL